MLLLAGAARGLRATTGAARKRPTMRQIGAARSLRPMRRMMMRRMTTRLLATSTGADALPALRADLAALSDEVEKTRPPAERVAAWQNDIRDLEAAATAPDFWDDSDKAQSALARLAALLDRGRVFFVPQPRRKLFHDRSHLRDVLKARPVEKTRGDLVRDIIVGV